MSKIEFDTEEQEVTITRKIGRGGESTVTVSPEVVGLQVNLGIVSLGATTDFGGAISLGITGQEITWGREGGTIHIGIGGFAVDVEARDCIVTETKSIFGIIVAQRSYRDPGCKPEKTPDPPKPPPPSEPEEDGTELLKTGVGWVFCKGHVDYKKIYTIAGYPDVYLQDEGYNEIVMSASDYNLNQFKRIDLSKCRADQITNMRTTVVSGEPPASWYQSRIGTRITKTYSVTFSAFTVATPAGSARLYDFISYEVISIEKNPSGYTGLLSTGSQDWIFHGDQVGIKAYIKNYNATKAVRTANTTETLQVIKVIPVDEVPKPPTSFLPTGNKPPMQNCCEEVLDMLEDIKEAFAVDRLLKDKFPVSNTFMAPGCDPASVTQAKNYYEIFQCVMRMMAHGMIFEPRVNIKDADAAKAGDQEFKAKYLNATGWASAVAEALLEVKDDGNVSTNMDIRNGFAATQTMVGLADAIYRINAILDGVGVELIPKVETVDTPYNVQIQIGKGFGEGNERQIDLNTDEATEKLLPTFLQVKKNKIKSVEIHPRSRSLKEILESIESNLPGGNNG